ncbi:MAG: hypothetical protein DCC52_05605 [Chloroflexi bacterium]|nr:MAG: hypothetical protein DCC52_05605 [Chloroflexota bacterium]
MPTERVLIVDDDPSILKLCLRILEPEGYRVATVTRGEDALLRLETEPFDVLLTDIRCGWAWTILLSNPFRPMRCACILRALWTRKNCGATMCVCGRSCRFCEPPKFFQPRVRMRRFIANCLPRSTRN